MKLFNPQDFKKIDEEANLSYGYPESILMENAGRGFFESLKRDFGYSRKLSFTVVCGKGNNAGDGFVISRYLFNGGYDISTIITAKRESYQGVALQNLNILIKLGVNLIEITKENVKYLSEILCRTDVLVDAIFGTGLDREVTGFPKEIIGLINENDCYDVLCVDVPSGLNSANGMFMGCGIKNNLKMVYTFGGLKTGFFLNDGERLGLAQKTKVIDVNYPKALLEKFNSGVELIDEEDIRGIVSMRNPLGTKFSYGHLLVIAGSEGKGGAAYMSALGGFKGGAGLVTLAVPEKINPAMEEKATEIITFPVPDSGKGYFTSKGSDYIKKSGLLKGKTAVVIGPGIGLNAGTKDFLFSVLSVLGDMGNVPVVIDADGLNILSEKVDFLNGLKGVNVVLTPHFKEMERLSGTKRNILEKDPFYHGFEFVKKYGVCLALKGASTYIFDKNAKEASLQGTHSPVLASGGSGDVLSGLTGSFISQGIREYDSARAASYLMTASAENLRLKYGDFGIGAARVAGNIPITVRNILKQSRRGLDA